eukprot:TRINITY_DN2645_c0_g1_i1.p1 TRINITY_DN2645_c0_g1~~TRINITY_DN2645_c0_g1_i1.p1  ORF type:complete len:793 (+),score=333.21 TRINITY_DN2645_c0_g1_i1:186-2381(+)
MSENYFLDNVLNDNDNIAEYIDKEDVSNIHHNDYFDEPYYDPNEPNLIPEELEGGDDYAELFRSFIENKNYQINKTPITRSDFSDEEDYEEYLDNKESSESDSDEIENVPFEMPYSLTPPGSTIINKYSDGSSTEEEPLEGFDKRKNPPPDSPIESDDSDFDPSLEILTEQESDYPHSDDFSSDKPVNSDSEDTMNFLKIFKKPYTSLDEAQKRVIEEVIQDLEEMGDMIPDDYEKLLHFLTERIHIESRSSSYNFKQGFELNKPEPEEKNSVSDIFESYMIYDKFPTVKEKEDPSDKYAIYDQHGVQYYNVSEEDKLRNLEALSEGKTYVNGLKIDADPIEVENFINEINEPEDSTEAATNMLNKGEIGITDVKDEYLKDFLYHKGLQELNEYAFAADGHADQNVIHPAITQKMYELYKRHPKFWTLDKLSQRFGVKKSKVQTILFAKDQGARLVKEGVLQYDPLGGILELHIGFQFQYEAGQGIFGVVRDKNHLIGFGEELTTLVNTDDRVVLLDSLKKTRKFPAFVHTDEDLDLQKLYFHTKKRHWYPEKLPRHPTKEQMDLFNEVLPAKPGTHISPPRPSIKGMFTGKKRNKPNAYKNRQKRIVTDTSDIPFKEIAAPVLTIEDDGSTRHATWEERCTIFEQPDNHDLLMPEEYRHTVDRIVFPFDAEDAIIMYKQKREEIENPKKIHKNYLNKYQTDLWKRLGMIKPREEVKRLDGKRKYKFETHL